MGWRSREKAVESAAAERLARLARQWRPGPAEGWKPLDEPPAADPWRAALQPDAEVESTPNGGPGWNGRSVRALLLLVAACLAAVGWWWWSGRPLEVVAAPIAIASGTPIATSPHASDTSPATTHVVVDVTGLVASPGLVTLPAGSRVADAVAAAGGPTKPRATDAVNMARILVDGEQIVIGGEPSTSGPASTGPPLVDLNSADPSVFETLPGVGPVLAARILEWRQANGPFRSVDELGEVSGIGDATLARLRQLVRV
jgi:competence protein ComEA